MYPMITVKFLKDYADDKTYTYNGCNIVLKGINYLKDEIHKFRCNTACELIRNGYAIEISHE